MLGLPGVFPVVECRRCGLVYLNPRPNDLLLARYYPEQYSPYRQQGGLVGLVTLLIRRTTARRIRSCVWPGARVLEIGCAAGDLLVPLRGEGLDVTGIEPSPYASSVARQRHGLRVHTGTVFDAPVREGSFDAIVMRGVVEHLPSPTAALRRVASLLRDEGYLFLATPNYDSLDRKTFGEFWHGFQVPRHLNLFDTKTLPRLLDAAGFEIRRLGYRIVTNDWIQSLGYLLEEKCGMRPRPALISMQNPLLHLLFLPMTVLQRFLKIGGRMEVVAVKARG